MQHQQYFSHPSFGIQNSYKIRFYFVEWCINTHTLTFAPTQLFLPCNVRKYVYSHIYMYNYIFFVQFWETCLKSHSGLLIFLLHVFTQNIRFRFPEVENLTIKWYKLCKRGKIREVSNKKSGQKEDGWKWCRIQKA